MRNCLQTNRSGRPMHMHTVPKTERQTRSCGLRRAASSSLLIITNIAVAGPPNWTTGRDSRSAPGWSFSHLHERNKRKQKRWSTVLLKLERNPNAQLDEINSHTMWFLAMINGSLGQGKTTFKLYESARLQL